MVWSKCYWLRGSLKTTKYAENTAPRPRPGIAPPSPPGSIPNVDLPILGAHGREASPRFGGGGVAPRWVSGARQVALALCLLALTGCSTLPRALNSPPPDPLAPKPHVVHVLSHGWHTGILVNAADLNQTLPALTNRFHGAAYYEMGWGDAGFYQAEQVTTRLTLQAMFYSSGSVIHLVAVRGDPWVEFSGSQWRSLRLSDAEYGGLLAYLRSSFQTNEAGALLPQHLGIYGDSQFYTAVGRYHLFNTCNKWTAKALRSAGRPIRPALKLTSRSVMRSPP